MSAPPDQECAVCPVEPLCDCSGCSEATPDSEPGGYACHVCDLNPHSEARNG